MRVQLASGLTEAQMLHYEEAGYYFPLRVFSEPEVQEFQASYLNYVTQCGARLQSLPANEHYMLLSETHTFLNWAYRIASHPNVLDAIECLLGPDLLVWSSRWFSKMPGDKTYVSWHQDATYWGLHPLQVVTAWIAISDSNADNGGMRVIPGTHKYPLLPQIETYAADNALSRGQEIAAEVDEAQAVDIVLRPGDMSLHHVGIVHGSKANTSNKPRIGLAVRYVAPEVIQQGSERPLAILVRGRDDYGNFELIHPPTDGATEAGSAMQTEVIRRMMKNILR
jgi:ectoine hydroxylase-related dioxygenase (phytanoyl-CoA dioxygenase family)